MGRSTASNAKVNLLKVHVPYHESDHILNITYNILSGGKRLEDIELNRNNEAYLDALRAQRIPDPTTAGDFTRRFSSEDIFTLTECINENMEWSRQRYYEGIIDRYRWNDSADVWKM